MPPQREYLEEEEEIVEFLPCSTSVEKDTAGLQHGGDKTDTEKVIRKVKWIELSRDRGTAYTKLD